jgi:hypothetical protein
MPHAPEKAKVRPMKRATPMGRFHGFKCSDGGDANLPAWKFLSSYQSIPVAITRAAGNVMAA